MLAGIINSKIHVTILVGPPRLLASQSQLLRIGIKGSVQRKELH
jgi:hypothetical protein